MVKDTILCGKGNVDLANVIQFKINVQQLAKLMIRYVSARDTDQENE